MAEDPTPSGDAVKKFEEVLTKSEGDAFDFTADMLSAAKEMMVKLPVLDHIDQDLDEFEDLEKRIKYLEGTMAKHADMHVVDGAEIQEADTTLHELDNKVLRVFEKHLLALKEQIMNPEVKLNNETISQVGLLIKTSEVFLDTARERVDSVEALAQEWVEEEESAAINQAIEQDFENQKKVYRQRQQKPWSGELKEKLAVARAEGPDGPVRLAGADRDRTKGEEGEMKLQKRKNMFSEIRARAGSKEDSWDAPQDSEENKKGDQDCAEDCMVKDDDYDEYIVKKMELEALKTAKENLDREAFYDAKGGREDQSPDPVDQYGPGVRGALDMAAGESRRFMQQALGEHRNILEAAGNSHAYRALGLSATALLVLAVILFMVRRKAARAVRRRRLFQGQESPSPGQKAAEPPAVAGFTSIELHEAAGGEPNSVVNSVANSVVKDNLTWTPFGPIRKSPQPNGRNTYKEK